MRVVHVAPTPFGFGGGFFGGGERYPLELARALAGTGEGDVRLVTFGDPSGRFRDHTGLRVHVLRPIGHLGGHPAHPVAPSLPRALRHADLVHAHHLKSAPSRIVAVTARLLGRRTAVTDHGLAGGDWGGLLPRLFDRFLPVSEYSARIMSCPPERTRVIYGGVDPERFAPGAGAARSGVLFVGRVTPHKGIDRLIEALPDGETLTVAGAAGHDPDPPERDYPADLRRLAAGRDVRFVGAVPERDLPELLRRAAVVVLPSVHVTRYGRRVAVSELLGLVVLEAMACGTPVVASRIGGVPEVVRDGETGFLVEPGDVGALRDRLCTLLGNPKQAARMGSAGRALVLERFTWRHVAERCLMAYSELGGR